MPRPPRPARPASSGPAQRCDGMKWSCCSSCRNAPHSDPAFAMTTDFAVTSRSAGRLLAGAGALLVLGLAVYTAIVETVPELHLYDGLWMLGGAGLALGLIAPLVWRWSRPHAMAALAVG